MRLLIYTAGFPSYRVVSLAFETVLFILNVIKFVEAIRGYWHLRPVLRQFVLDGTYAYALIFGTKSWLARFVGFITLGLQPSTYPRSNDACQSDVLCGDQGLSNLWHMLHVRNMRSQKRDVWACGLPLMPIFGRVYPEGRHLASVAQLMAFWHETCHNAAISNV